jgi:hypothetical protein
MKALIISMCMIMCFSCSNFEEELSLGEHKVTYMVLTESGDWFGQYIDKRGDTVRLHEEPFQHGEWTHSFVTHTLPDILFIEASSEQFPDSTILDKPDITASLYVDGELIETKTNSIMDGKTEASNTSLPL